MIFIKFRITAFSAKAAFSLVEISIALIIAGVLLSIYVKGASLIGHARIVKVISEMQEMHSAIMEFKRLYYYIPGDFPYASGQWGIDACVAQGATAVDGANGDGNGVIIIAPRAAVNGVRDRVNETYTAWCHLFKAGLMPYETIPLVELAEPNMELGVNVPASKALKGVGYFITGYTSARTEYNVPGATLLIIGGKPQGGIFYKYTAALTPKQAYAIDKKMDNGVPDTGQLVCTDTYNDNSRNSYYCHDHTISKYRLNASHSNDKICTCAIIIW